MLLVSHNFYLDTTIAQHSKEKYVAFDMRKHSSALRALYAIILTPDEELLASVRTRGLDARHVHTCVAMEALIGFETELATLWFHKSLFVGDKVRLPRGKRNASLLAVFPFLSHWAFIRYRPYLGISCLPVLRPVAIDTALKSNSDNFAKLRKAFGSTCGVVWRNVQSNRSFQFDDLIQLMQKHFTDPSAIVRTIVRFRSKHNGNIRHQLGTTVSAAVRWCDEFVTPYPLPAMPATTGTDKEIVDSLSSDDEDVNYVKQLEPKRYFETNASDQIGVYRRKLNSDNETELNARFAEFQKEFLEFQEKFNNLVKAVIKY